MKLTSIFFLIIGLTSITFFYFDIYFSVATSVAIATFILFLFAYQLKKKQTGILICLTLAIYLLPFIHIIPYIFFNFNNYYHLDRLPWWNYSESFTLGYIFDEQIIKLTAMLGATGAAGIAFGTFVNGNKLDYGSGFNLGGGKRLIKTMSLTLWFLWLLIGLILGHLAAGKESIFQTFYVEKTTWIDGISFSSAGMMYMTILSYTFADALFDNKTNRRKIKLLLSFVLLFYVIIWLELLRGERETLVWMFALFLAYFYWPSFYLSGFKTKIPWLKIIFFIFLLLFITNLIGLIRTNIAGKSLSEVMNFITQNKIDGNFDINNMIHGTWSAVMLTPISVSGDYIRGILDLKWGLDYLNIILSLPPGFVADLFGYERPLNSFQGPAWEVSFGIGGVHAIVVPFKNFGILGVFLITAIWSYIISNYEKKTLRKLSVINLSFLITIVTALPEWLWYGDKYIINAVIIWYILSLFYKISLGLTHESRSY